MLNDKYTLLKKNYGITKHCIIIVFSSKVKQLTIPINFEICTNSSPLQQAESNYEIPKMIDEPRVGIIAHQHFRPEVRRSELIGKKSADGGKPQRAPLCVKLKLKHY